MAPTRSPAVTSSSRHATEAGAAAPAAVSTASPTPAASATAYCPAFTIIQNVLGLVGRGDLLPHRLHGLQERLVVHLGELQPLAPQILDGLALPVLEERALVHGRLGAGLQDPLLDLGRLAGQELGRDQDGPWLRQEMEAGLGHVLHRLVDLGGPQRGVVDGGALDHALLHRGVELGERQRGGVGAERAHRLDERGVLHHADLHALEVAGVRTGPFTVWMPLSPVLK